MFYAVLKEANKNLNRSGAAITQALNAGKP